MAAIAVPNVEHISFMFPMHAEVFPFKTSVDLNAGDLVYFNASGLLVKSSAAAAGTAKCAGMAMRSVRAGQTVDVLKEGHVEGLAVTGLAYGAKVYMANAAGGLDDAAGTVSTVMGSVVPTSEQG